MKSARGLGNYRFAQNIERRPGELIAYRADAATVRFRDGQVYSLPAQAMRAMQMVEGERFVLVVVRQGKTVVDIRVERLAPARPVTGRTVMPKVLVRDGKRMTTRK